MSTTGGTHRRIYRLPNSPTVVNVRAPFYLDDKRMFDDGDLLIATFEKAEEGPSIVRLLNSAETLLEAAKDAVRLLDDHVDNALDAAITLREAIRKVEEQPEADFDYGSAPHPSAHYRNNDDHPFDGVEPGLGRIEGDCGFVRTDGEAGGFFWCVCAENCNCEHCAVKGY